MKRPVLLVLALAGLLLFTGPSVRAEGDELDPRTVPPKPIDLAICLDTSGSMLTKELTVAPYDSTISYLGGCDVSKVYWTDVDVLPVCNFDQNRFVSKDAFHCQFAADQINGIGSYTNTMVQYRDGGKDGLSPGAARHRQLGRRSR